MTDAGSTGSSLLTTPQSKQAGRMLVMTTSSARAGLALYEDSQQVFIAENSNQRTHSDWIHVALSDGLNKNNWKASDLTHVAVDRGPGSFTGVRVGFNIAKSLCYALNTYLWSISSLEILLETQKSPAAALTNAYRNMIYLATACSQGHEPKALSLKDALQVLQSEKDWTLVGDGFAAYPAFANQVQSLGLKLPTFQNFYPSVEHLADLALRQQASAWTKDWKSIVPLYIRASEPEENAKTVP